jgi:PAS domain S-box-containing protein
MLAAAPPPSAAPTPGGSPGDLPARDMARRKIRSFALIVAIFVVLLLIALAASWYAIEVVNSTRAYATGEAHYSKAQKIAVLSLHRYADSRLEIDYAAFLAATSIERGDLQARLALESRPVDIVAAEAGFLEGGNHAEDLDSMIWLFRRFSWWGPFAEAVADWRESDPLLRELIALGARLHERGVEGTLDRQTRDWLLGDVDRVDYRLSALETAFATHIGEAARGATRLVITALSIATIVLWTIGTAFASRLFRQQLAIDRQLAAGEQRFRQLFEVASDYFFETDADHRLTSASPNYEAIVGIPIAGDIGTRLAERAGVAIDSEMKKMARLAEEQRKPVRDLIYSRKLPNGELRWISASVVPVFGEDGAFRGLRGVGANITSRINAESHLHHAQRLESLGMLAGGITHEINNALVPVIALTKIVARDLPADSRERRLLTTALRGAERASDLVKQILAFSRKEQERRREPVDLGAVLREALRLMRATLPASIRLQDEIAPAPAVTGDPNQLHQVIVNLMTNAAQAIGDAMGVITIRLTPEPEGAQLRLSVTDSGCGMDETTKARLFEPFFTTKEVGKGTGLGLAVVHGMIKDHGGRIVVESAPGQGSRFDVFLPIDTTKPAAADLVEVA